MLCDEISDAGLVSHLTSHVAQFIAIILNILVICLKRVTFKMTAYATKYRQVAITVTSMCRLTATKIFVNIKTTCYNTPEHETVPVETSFLQAKQSFFRTEKHPEKLSVSCGKNFTQTVLLKKQRNIHISENIYICFKKQ